MIIARNLTKSIEPDQTILSQISFQADPGELIAVIGQSGSGKTTLLRCLALEEAWSGGQYIVNNENIAKMTFWQKQKWGAYFAYLAEKPELSVNRTAVQNVLEARKHSTPLWRRWIGRRSVDEHVLAMDYLEKVGLLDKGEVPAGQLSGGEQRRVAVAKALIQGAKVIVADEPITGLDPVSAQGVLRDLRAVCKQENMIVICTLSELRLAEQHATRIWGLAGGRLALDIAARRLSEQERRLVYGGESPPAAD